MDRTALLGIRDCDLRETLVEIGRVMGYTVASAQTQTELEELAKKKPFDLYVMDLNFKANDKYDLTPARTIYALVRERVEAGHARFVGISGYDNLVELAKREGIPAKIKENPLNTLF